jgi:hypothetical protein
MKTLSRFDMHCYNLHEQYITERLASAEVTAPIDADDSRDPLANLKISFNGLRPMTLQKFINDYAKKDEEANIILSRLLELFEDDLQSGRIPGAKGKQDFPKWLVAKFGDDNPQADVLIFNPGDSNMKTSIDEKEAALVTKRWNDLGFSLDIDDLLRASEDM